MNSMFQRYNEAFSALNDPNAVLLDRNFESWTGFGYSANCLEEVGLKKRFIYGSAYAEVKFSNLSKTVKKLNERGLVVYLLSGTNVEKIVETK